MDALPEATASSKHAGIGFGTGVMPRWRQSFMKKALLLAYCTLFMMSGGRTPPS